MNIKEKLKKRTKTIREEDRFTNEMTSRVAFWTSLFECLTIFYCILIGSIPLDKLAFAIISGILICVVLHFIIFWIVNTQVTQPISEDLATFYFYDTTEKERTKLMKRLMRLPGTMAAVVFVLYVVHSAGWLAIFSKTVRLDSDALILMSAMTYFGAFCASVWALSMDAQKISSKHASKIVEKGVSKPEVERIHFFGISSSAIAVCNLFAPILITSILIFLLAWRAYTSYMTANLVFPRLILMTVVGTSVYVVYSYMAFKRMMRSINGMRELMEGINRESLYKVKPERTDLSNEFMYNIYLINKIISILQKILKESQDISMSVVESSNELSVISRETAVTSLEQNSGVKELLSAMEETDNLSKNIAEKIGEVSLVAKKTTENIVDGFGILKQNMQKLDEIKAANDVTVEGIKKLTEKITGIYEIARIINGIADQTNIIAFNAEIEASSAGDVGENFALVANEIRRLTNNTIQSTNEIRNRIIEIQHSSDALLASSQNGSNKILDGTRIINELNERFEDLQHSSESMDYASEDIKKIIDQQTASFAQIVVTLRQITAAADTFSSSTQKISDSAQNLCLISTNLKNLQPENMEEYTKESEHTQAEVDAIVESMTKEVK